MDAEPARREDTGAYFEVVHVGCGVWIHYCYVTEDSYEHQVQLKPIGAACCDDFGESVEKTVLPVDSYINGSCWPVAALSRWTHVSELLKRVYVASIGPRALSQAVSDAEATWGINAGMEAPLDA